ncbi:MAG: PIN domain nuclease [Deltaproteobacteria bacterium]|nr:PIN domain nuclease [Deltaproteobacteria bacterium]
MAGLTFDTGALVALERRRQRMRRVLATAIRDNLRVSVPAVVITEWWRGRTDLAADILASVDVEPMDEDLAKVAGEALAAVKRATAVDAIVMASAARRGDVVYTSDFDDLSSLQVHFRSVRVLGI